MARKDQKKLFFLACIADDPFVKMLKEHKIPFTCWTYINAIKKQRDKLQKLFYSQIKGDLQKQLKATVNKATAFFYSLPHDKITLEHYISFLCGLCNDLWWEVKKKTEKDMLAKIEGHLFKLYQKFDPDIIQNKEIDKALMDLKKVENYF